MNVTVKVDSHMLGTGHILSTVGLEFQNLLAVLFELNCMDEFCLGRPFISFELLLFFGPSLGLLSFSLLSFFLFFFFLLFLLLSPVIFFLFLLPVRILFGLL